MKYWNKIFWLTLFSIAMGFMESAVVVYLRELYYPNGFEFPMVVITNHIAVTEFFREAATIIMLVAIGLFTGKTASRKFGYFIYSFAIWDLFYYIFLKILLNWPETMLTWDILFLIPVPWVGPVIAPCLVSLLMMLFMISIEFHAENGKQTKVKLAEWLLFISGSLIVILSFVWDYLKYMRNVDHSADVWSPSGKNDMFQEIRNYVPQEFNWLIFIMGMVVILGGLLKYNYRLHRN